jgi:hypothetical protein
LLLPQCRIHRAGQSPPQLHRAGAASTPSPNGAGHGSWQHWFHLHCGHKTHKGSVGPDPDLTRSWQPGLEHRRHRVELLDSE